MRLRQFNPELTSQTDQPVGLHVVSAARNDILFQNVDVKATVRSVRYWSPAEGDLRTQVELNQDGKLISFTVRFAKAPVALGGDVGVSTRDGDAGSPEIESLAARSSGGR